MLIFVFFHTLSASCSLLSHCYFKIFLGFYFVCRLSCVYVCVCVCIWQNGHPSSNNTSLHSSHSSRPPNTSLDFSLAHNNNRHCGSLENRIFTEKIIGTRGVRLVRLIWLPISMPSFLVFVSLFLCVCNIVVISTRVCVPRRFLLFTSVYLLRASPPSPLFRSVCFFLFECSPFRHGSYTVQLNNFLYIWNDKSRKNR